MDAYLRPLDDVITHKLLPALLGTGVSNTDRQLYSLPIREGGLGMAVLEDIAKWEFESSTSINAPLVATIMLQGADLSYANVQNTLSLQSQ